MHTTLTVGLSDWEVWQHAKRLSPITITERIRVLRRFHIETGVQPAHADAIDIVRWIAGHDEWSDSTAATYTSYLAAWYNWLQIDDRRADNPMIKVGTPKVPEREPRPIADADVPRLLATRMWGINARNDFTRAARRTTRTRDSEDPHRRLDLGAGLLWVTGKGRKPKSIPLHPILAEIAAQMPPTGWWFPMRGHPGEHVHRKSVSEVISRTMRRAGVKGTPHALRHWYATSLLDDGNDLRVVQELMRHRSIASTQICTKVSDRTQRKATANLDLFRERNRNPLTPLDETA
ncbi:tyrosine-type recombinase/integrase [Gordonia sp. CPCC 205333]|uniref:tyrosine-type recombinase/integrase n=1 Tax=Gordonia sp. CPCC 205333 TaxID=3140790 RepID=UPI003AF37B0A